MHVTFFPEPLFGWAYFGALLAILAAASCLDLRFMAVPKWLTVPALGGRSPVSTLTRVVLPAPFGPMIDTCSPSPMTRLTPSSAQNAKRS